MSDYAKYVNKKHWILLAFSALTGSYFQTD